MHAWLITQLALARGNELRDEAARWRLARGAQVAGGRWLRRRLARALLSVGSSFVAASHRVHDEAA